MNGTAESVLPVIPGLAPGAEHRVPSLPEVHSSVGVSRSPNYWRRLLGFLGPGFLISVGYMDPGNWATDIEAGSRYGMALLWVVLLSSVAAIAVAPPIAFWKKGACNLAGCFSSIRSRGE